MTRLSLVGSGLLSLIAAPTLAADLPVRTAPPVFVPPPAAVWDGFYAGLNAGVDGSSGGSSTTGVPVFGNPGLGAGPSSAVAIAQAATVSGGKPTNIGFIGGLQIGYNKQIDPMFVVGVEADIQGLVDTSRSQALSGTAPIPTFPNSTVVTTNLSNRIDYLGTARGRLGYLVNPSFLLYATGGLAYGGVKTSTNTIENLLGPSAVVSPALASGSSSSTRVGYTIGAGVEYLISPSISLKAEYLYYDLGRVGSSAYLSTSNIFGTLFTTDRVTASARESGSIGRVGINYHFSIPVPVVARY